MTRETLEETLARLRELRWKLERRPDEATLRAIERELGRLSGVVRVLTAGGVGADADAEIAGREARDDGDDEAGHP